MCVYDGLQSLTNELPKRHTALGGHALGLLL